MSNAARSLQQNQVTSGCSADGGERKAVVECNQHAPSMHRESQQIHIGQNFRTTNLAEIKMLRIGQRNIVSPELMIAGRGRLSQAPSGFGQRQSGRVSRLRQNTHTTIFGQRARCPSLRSICDQPLMSTSMMDVCRIKQCDQEIDIEEGRHQPSVYSRSLPTNSAVITRFPAGITSKPAATPARRLRPRAGVVFRPRRNTSEITLPAVCLERAAISFAATKTSSSRSIVVRMSRMLAFRALGASRVYFTWLP